MLNRRREGGHFDVIPTSVATMPSPVYPIETIKHATYIYGTIPQAQEITLVVPPVITSFAEYIGSLPDWCRPLLEHFHIICPAETFRRMLTQAEALYLVSDGSVSASDG